MLCRLNFQLEVPLTRLFCRLALAFVAFSAVVSNRAAAQQFPESTYQEMRWRMIGPPRGGRTRAACGVPSQPNVFYMGAVNRGAWNSDDFWRASKPLFVGPHTQISCALSLSPCRSHTY